MIHRMLTLPLVILVGSFVMADDKQKPLFDFSKPDALKAWQTVNDGVMGGASEGNVRLSKEKTDNRHGHASSVIGTFA